MKIVHLVTVIVILFLIVGLDVPSLSAQGPAGWVIDGDTVYIDDDNAYLSATPHTLHRDGWVEFELMSKQWSGYIDVVWGLPLGTGVKVSHPQKWATNVDHPVSEVQVSQQQYSQRFNDILSYQPLGWASGEQPDLGNRNNTYLIKLELGQQGGNITYLNIAFNSYVQHNATSATFTGNYDARQIVTTHSYYDDWTAWNPPPIVTVNYTYAGVDQWHVVQLDAAISEDVTYKVRCWVDIPEKLGGFTVKYVWAIKPRAETIQQAHQNEHLYVLDPWLSGGWQYRKIIPITNSTGAGTNYQVPVTVYKSGTGDSTGVVKLNDHCTNFPLDLTFTDDDGTTELWHWYETNVGSNSTYRAYWINVTDDLGSNRNITIYYGKSGGSSSYMNADLTFLFHDDFPGSSLNTSKWTGDTGSASVASGELTYSSSLAWQSIYGPTMTGASTAMKTMGYLYGSGGFGLTANQPASAYTWHPSSKYILTAATTNSNWTMGSYHIQDILVRYGTNAAFYQDAVQVQASPRTDSMTSGTIKCYVSVYNYYHKLDWILARKYVYPEPVVGTAYSEETAPPSAVGFSWGQIIG